MAIIISEAIKMQKGDSVLSGSRRSGDRDSESSLHVHKLVERIQRISSSIQIDTNSKGFKFLDMDRQNRHFKEDPHTLLRNIENKSQINRAEVELLSQRRPKHYSIRTTRQPQDHQETYLSVYNRLKHQKIFKEKNDTELTSEQELLEQHNPNGVKHYAQLRQHPRILQFTLDRLRDKSLEGRIQMRKNEGKEELKSASKPSVLQHIEDYKQIIENMQGRKVDPLQSPKAIVNNQIAKFYSKSSKGKLDVKIKQNPRCVKLLERQQQLVTALEDNSISKENMKKLKQRLNVIINQINKSDKTTTHQHLPKIGQSPVKNSDPE